MADLSDVRRIALRLPGASVSDDGRACTIPVKGKEKGFAWCWNERIVPKRPKVPNEQVLAIVVRNLSEKEILLGSDPAVFFTEPHYNGFPAVLVRLEAVSLEQLEDLLTEGWRCKAPPDLQKLLDR